MRHVFHYGKKNKISRKVLLQSTSKSELFRERVKTNLFSKSKAGFNQMQKFPNTDNLTILCIWRNYLTTSPDQQILILRKTFTHKISV